MELNILYEDNHLIVVVKPEGILSQKDKTDEVDIQYYIKQYLKAKYNKPGEAYLGLVHRLDRRVGGVMVFAKTSKAASRLSEAIRHHQFEKSYLAICANTLDASGHLESKISKVNQKAVFAEDGKLSTLDYVVLKKFTWKGQLFTIVDINLISGRYNQIRFQLSMNNNPILNDYKYGYTGENYNDQLGLCCYKIGFMHPVTKQKMVFEYIPTEGIWEHLKQ